MQLQPWHRLYIASLASACILAIELYAISQGINGPSIAASASALGVILGSSLRQHHAPDQPSTSGGEGATVHPSGETPPESDSKKSSTGILFSQTGIIKKLRSRLMKSSRR